MTWKQSHWFALAARIDNGRVTGVAGTWFDNGNGNPGRGGVITVDPTGQSAPMFQAVANVLLTRMRHAEVIVAYDAPRVLGALEAEFTTAGLLSEWIGIVGSGQRLVVDPLVLVNLKRVGRFWKRRWADESRHDLLNAADRLDVMAPGDADRPDCRAILTGRVLWHLAEHMPDDAADAAAWLAEKREEQEREHREWREREGGGS